MYKTTARSKKANHYNIYNDLAKIKDAFADATYGMRDHAGDVISKSIDDVREKSSALQEGVSSYVSEKPLKSVGVALLAGMLLGYFIHK